MAAALRSLGFALRSSVPVLTAQNTVRRRCIATLKEEELSLSYKLQLTNFARKHWSNLSQENRSMMKQSFINLTVPAIYGGFIWLVSAGADIVKDTLRADTLDDETTTLRADVQSVKEELDEKIIQIVRVVEKLKDEREINKSEISRLQGKILEKEEELQMLRELLSGHMGQIGIVWLKCFLKNVNNASLLSYYDVPEATGLSYWNTN